MRVFIGEFTWQIEDVLKNASAEDLIISCSPSFSFQCEKHKIVYAEIFDIIQFDFFIENFEPLLNKTLLICETLDKHLRGIAPDIQKTQLKPFDAFHLPFKVWFDQTYVFACLLSEIINNHSPSVIYHGTTGPLHCTKEGLPSPNSSLISALLDAQQFHYLSSKSTPSKRSHDTPSPFQFGQPNIDPHSFVHFVNNLTSYITASLSKKNIILSVACKDASLTLLNRSDPRYTCYNYNKIVKPINNNCFNPHSFINMIQSDSTLVELFSVSGINFFPIFTHFFSYVFNLIPTLFHLYENDNKLFARNKISHAIFQSMSPFYLPNITLRALCTTHEIPYFCWMHGGYGAYNSLQGYDFVDYRLCKNHIVYGKILSENITRPQSMPNQLKYGPHSIKTCGAPRLEAQALSIKKKPSKLKTITLFIGSVYEHNQYYFGYNRQSAYYSSWKKHVEIITSLLPHQNKYNIIIRDYPASTNKTLWLEILKHYGAYNFIYDQSNNFQKVLSNSDLNIFTWVSTTFFQSIFSPSDIFLHDDSDFFTTPLNLFHDEIYFSSNQHDLELNLNTYLSAGIFYTKDKHHLRDHFLDHTNINKRHEQLHSILKLS